MHLSNTWPSTLRQNDYKMYLDNKKKHDKYFQSFPNSIKTFNPFSYCLLLHANIELDVRVQFATDFWARQTQSIRMSLCLYSVGYREYIQQIL